jgi:hypothetical protein
MTDRASLRKRALAALRAPMEGLPKSSLSAPYRAIRVLEKTPCVNWNIPDDEIIYDYLDLLDELPRPMFRIFLTCTDANEPRVRAALGRLLAGGKCYINLDNCRLSALDVGAWLRITTWLTVVCGDIKYTERASDWFREGRTWGGRLDVYTPNILPPDRPAEFERIKKMLDGRKLGQCRIFLTATQTVLELHGCTFHAGGYSTTVSKESLEAEALAKEAEESDLEVIVISDDEEL